MKNSRGDKFSKFEAEQERAYNAATSFTEAILNAQSVEELKQVWRQTRSQINQALGKMLVLKRKSAAEIGGLSEGERLLNDLANPQLLMDEVAQRSGISVSTIYYQMPKLMAERGIERRTGESARMAIIRGGAKLKKKQASTQRHPSSTAAGKFTLRQLGLSKKLARDLANRRDYYHDRSVAHANNMKPKELKRRIKTAAGTLKLHIGRNVRWTLVQALVRKGLLSSKEIESY